MSKAGPAYVPLLDFHPQPSLHSTIVDLRLNENKIRSVHYSSLSRFGNLTYLNLTKNDISYVEDGAFSAQFNLQVSVTLDMQTPGLFQMEESTLAPSVA